MGLSSTARTTDRGLANQGWKDSHDAVFHADGTLAVGPIALSEVQGYVYAAKHHAAELADALGHAARGGACSAKPSSCTRRSNGRSGVKTLEPTRWRSTAGSSRVAWCRPTPGNVSSVASRYPDRARRIADTMMAPDMFSGWGVRTIRNGESRYNPMAYHNGSIWPHDTALVALGFARYGLKDHVVRVAEGLFSAAQQFGLRRLPELFCGFSKRSGEPPTRYPTACAPQAWAAASAFLVVQALLGLDVDARRKRVTFRQPRLPPMLEWLRLTGLRVGDAELDLLCERRGDDVGISVVRRTGDVRLATER